MKPRKGLDSKHVGLDPCLFHLITEWLGQVTFSNLCFLVFKMGRSCGHHVAQHRTTFRIILPYSLVLHSSGAFRLIFNVKVIDVPWTLVVLFLFPGL